jgi:hypothetical protein
MMKAAGLSIILLFVFGSVMPIDAQTSQQIKLGMNKQKLVSKDKLTIKFVSVIEDSRCPVGVNCVWSGNAKVQIQMTNRKGISKIFELNTHLEPQTVTFEGYEIKLAGLLPRPRANTQIDAKRYTATFILTK